MTLLAIIEQNALWRSVNWTAGPVQLPDDAQGNTRQAEGNVLANPEIRAVEITTPSFDPDVETVVPGAVTYNPPPTDTATRTDTIQDIPTAEVQEMLRDRLYSRMATEHDKGFDGPRNRAWRSDDTGWLWMIRNVMGLAQARYESLTLSATTGTGITVTADTASWTADDVGCVVEVPGGGAASIVAYTSAKVVTADVTTNFAGTAVAPGWLIQRLTFPIALPNLAGELDGLTNQTQLNELVAGLSKHMQAVNTRGDAVRAQINAATTKAELQAARDAIETGWPPDPTL